MLIRWPGTEACWGSDTGIIRAQEVAPLRSAHAVAVAAEQEASDALESARLRGRAIVDEAQQKALELVADAESRAQTLVQERVQACEIEQTTKWHAHHAALQQAWTDRVRQQEAALADVVMRVVRRVVESSPLDAQLTRAAAQIRQQLQGQKGVSLRVSLNDQASAAAWVAVWQAQADRAFDLDLVCEPDFGPRQCVFDSPMGTLDVSLDVQLAALGTLMQRAVDVMEPRGAQTGEHDDQPTPQPQELVAAAGESAGQTAEAGPCN